MNHEEGLSPTNRVTLLATATLQPTPRLQLLARWDHGVIHEPLPTGQLVHH